MKRLTSRYVTPPGGWRYVDPDTGFAYEDRYLSLHSLLAHIARYREQNHLPPIHKLHVEEWLCAQPNMARHCKEFAGGRSISQYLRGAKAAAKIRTSDKEVFVSQPTAEARSHLCVNCPHNQIDKSSSRFKRYSDSYIQGLVGDRRTTNDDKLFSCQVCSCLLRSKVHISQAIAEGSLSRKERRILDEPITGLDGKTFYCWQLHPVAVPSGAVHG